MKSQNENRFSLNQVEKKNIFSVPADYFHLLPKRIEGRILDCNSELKKNIYQLPDYYFEQLSVQINDKVGSENILINSNLKDNVFIAPDAYFIHLQGDIQAKTSVKIRSTLDEKAENIHIVPDDYFDTLGDKIQERIGKKDNVVKVDFTTTSEFRYAIAASVTLLLIVSCVFFFQPYFVPQLSKVEDNQGAIAVSLIASLDKKEIKKYLEKEEGIEMHDIIEYSSDQKKQKIKADFENNLLSIDIGEKEKHSLEMEWNDIDVSELQTDI